MQTTIESKLAFTRPGDVYPDDERPGLLRARTLDPDVQSAPRSFDLENCRITDCNPQESFRPDLVRHGFDTVDLSARAGLQSALERVRVAGHVRVEDASEIRQQLRGASLRLGDGSRLRFLFIAPEGFIMRKAGPNGMAVSPTESMSEMNDHDAALAIHADQDVKGTPLRQLMRGRAPWLFRHDTPDARNTWSPLMLVNLWIPLQQITRPLVLMDKRTLDRGQHQLRYGLPTDDFLDRDEDRRVNDIWTFLHHDQQRWYFTSEMDSKRAYVFDTLGTPHGSCIAPGEELAERRYRLLDAAREAVRIGGEAALRRATDADRGDLRSHTTLALRRALEAMGDLLEEAREKATPLCQGRGADSWRSRSQQAMDRVVRKSIEMRVVALRTPSIRPFGRR